ncbi:MAG: rhodanese-related sulfurtransferase [Acholeplasmataceae bacterium]|nr:rhodanese-related sulfurtransferase [Acholeplasmataceae bacterium]
MIHAYRVLLFYHYTKINNPEDLQEQHLLLCKKIGLLGRVYISSEGINGTVSGTLLQTEIYMKTLKTDPVFKGIVFKSDETDDHAFKKIHVRTKNELVNFSLDEDINPLEITGKYVEPSEFLQGLSNPDTIIIDARNTYEYDLGHFRGALRPNIQTFRELPRWIRENKNLLQNKKIMTYCTGGVRCEKFSGWLKKEGFDDVGQLHGGIVNYGKDSVTRGQFWDGKCYVFDQRISVPINHIEHVIVGRDYFTGEPCERYINCTNPECNKQIICSEENEHRFLGACSTACRKHPRNRYVKKMKE